MAERNVPAHMTSTWQAATSDPDPLVALGATRALGDLLAAWESKLVQEAIAAGATWESVGSSVGVSRQAAWQRFHHHVDDGFRDRVRREMQDLRNRQREERAELVDRIRSEARGRRRSGR